MDEKRIKLRLSVDIPVKIRFNGVTMPAKSRNLSCGGIFVQTPKAPDPHQKCELILTLPDGKAPMVVSSEVVWKEDKEGPVEVAPPPAAEHENHEAAEETFDDEHGHEEAAGDDSDGAGMQFESLDPEQKARINAFLERTIRENLH